MHRLSSEPVTSGHESVAPPLDPSVEDKAESAPVFT